MPLDSAPGFARMFRWSQLVDREGGSGDMSRGAVWFLVAASVLILLVAGAFTAYRVVLVQPHATLVNHPR